MLLINDTVNVIKWLGGKCRTKPGLVYLLSVLPFLLYKWKQNHDNFS